MTGSPAVALALPTARVLVRDALRRLVTGASWPFPTWTVLQNRLLDEVGGDLRPLVALLVRAGEAGLVDQLPTSRAAWPQVRGALVLSLTHGAFLQPEMARWAVECWAYAMGVVDAGELTVAADGPPAPGRGATPTPLAAQTPVPARSTTPAAAPARVPAQGPSQGPAGIARTPVPRPGPAMVTPAMVTPAVVTPAVMAPAPFTPPVHVAGGSRVAPVTRPARRGLWPDGLDNVVARTSLAGIAAFVGYVVYSAAGMRPARATELGGGAAPAAAPSVAGEPGDAVPGSLVAFGIPGVTSRGLPQGHADSARMIHVVPARRPTLPLEQLPVPPAAPRGAATAPPVRGAAIPSAPSLPARLVPAATAVPPQIESPRADGFDRLRLHDGRVLRGRVELVRVAAVVFRDAETGLRYEYPKRDVDLVVTEFGSVVRFSPGPAAAATPAVARPGVGATLVRRGVGGRYRVRYAVASVNGSPECRRGWSSPPPEAWARVDHAPGADTLAVTFDGGATFASVIDDEAQFASTFVIVPDQAYTGTALTTRLNGRFVPGGFEAAVNLVGYRRVNAGRDVACHTVLRAVGRRGTGNF